jgi:cell division protein FtsI (penicillin-binding protein 3)
MSKNNSKITLEDQQNDILYKTNKSNLNITFNRVAFIFFTFFVISLIFSIHLIHLGSRKENTNNNIILKKFSSKLNRSDILDRDGNYLSKTVNSIDIGISPSKIIDEKKLLLNLKYIFPNKNYIDIKKKIKRGKFFYFEKKVSEDNFEKLMKLGDKSIEPRENIIRIYPQKNLFSHILGQIDNENNGISGLEKSLDEDLKKNFKPVKLTVDTNIQYLIREELMKFNKIFRTKGSASILMNTHNGEILSFVSLPDFDLNQRENITDKNFINRVSKGTYELGSVFKPFTFAAALDMSLIETKTEFKNLPKSINCAGFPIREYDEDIPSTLTAEQILIRSGNIGSVRIAQKIGSDKFQNFLEKIGVIGNMDFDIEEVAVQKNLSMGKCKLETASYGHGISTTLLNLAKGYSVISNGGYDVRPNLIYKKIEQKKNLILKKNVSEEVVKVLRKIVTDEEGTAGLANVDGYEVAGKTGTAEQVIDGQYSKTKINTFASVFPSSNPKYVLIVMLDSPKGSSTYVYNYRNKKGNFTGTPFNTAGWTSVEVAGQIIEKIGPILATKYLQVY